MLLLAFNIHIKDSNTDTIQVSSRAVDPIYRDLSLSNTSTGSGSGMDEIGAIAHFERSCKGEYDRGNTCSHSDVYS